MQMFWKISTQKWVVGDLCSRWFLSCTRDSFKCWLLGVQTHRIHHGLIYHDRMNTTSRWCTGACDECWHRCLRVCFIDSLQWVHHSSNVHKFSVHGRYRYRHYHNVNLTCYSARVMYMVSSRQHPYYGFMYYRCRQRSRLLFSDKPVDRALW